jgi:hypothetical protein
MTEIRDRELRRALRDLDVPDHRPDFDAELRRRLLEPRPRSRRWMLAAAAVLALIAASVTALLLPKGSGVASAAQVREAISDAFASAGTVSGVFVNREQANGRANRWRFVLSSSGSFRITGLGGNPTDLAYDSDANVEYWSDLGLFTRRTGLAPGWPDAAAAGWVVQRGLGSVVAALAASGDTKVEEIDHEGRSAWLLRTPTGNPGELRLITVDRKTGIPVRDERMINGRFAREWRIEQLKVDKPVSDETFRLERSPSQQLTAYDMGFRPAGDDAVRLTPEWLPSGFKRDAVAVARSSRPTGGEQHRNPPSRDVVSARYRRGLDEIVITTRLTGPDPSAWADPVLGSSVRARAPERIMFSAGALKGREGELLIDPNSVPHVWAIAGPLVVTIAGNVDRDELVRIAESLRRK